MSDEYQPVDDFETESGTPSNEFDETSSNSMAASSSTAEEWAALAEKWATNPENTVVEDGKFSALHHALKAEAANTVTQEAKDIAVSTQTLIEQMNHIIVCDTVADVRALGIGQVQGSIRLMGYHTVRDGGGGYLVYDPNDTTTADDGFINFVDTQGRRWKRDWQTGGFVTPLMAGAITNDAANDAGDALHQVFVWSGENQVRLHIPATGETSGGGKCRYFCNRTLPLYTNHQITGSGADIVEIRFTNNTHGIVSAASGTTITAGFSITGFTVRGVADTSSATTATTAIYLFRCRDFVIGINVDKWVNCMRMDPQNTGFINGRIYGDWFQTYFPNKHNNGPNIGLYIDDTGSKKVQILDLVGLKIYSQLTTTKIVDLVPINSEFSFTITLPLYKASGIKVNRIDAEGFKTRDTDFQLYDETSGRVLLADTWENPGDVTVGDVTTPTNLGITFGSTWSQGETFEIVWNDPWGNKAVFVADGSGIVSKGGHFGGYDIILDTFGTDMIFTPDYVQLANVFGRVRSGATNNEIWALEFNNTIQTMYVADANTKPKVNPDRGVKEPEQINTGSYSGTSASTVSGSEIICRGKFPNRRIPEFNLNLKMACPDQRSMRTTVEVMKVKNRGTPEIIQKQRIDVVASTNTGNSTNDAISHEEDVTIKVFDDEVADFVGGVTDEYRYYLQVYTNRDNGTVDVQSGGTYNSWANYIELGAY